MAPAIAGAIALVSVAVVATASLGLLYSARVKAANAADAAALAAAAATYPGTRLAAPAEAARTLAAANGARLVSCRCPVDASLHRRIVTVVTLIPVDVPVFGRLEVRAASRAEFDPARWLGR